MDVPRMLNYVGTLPRFESFDDPAISYHEMDLRTHESARENLSFKLIPRFSNITVLTYSLGS